MSNVVHLSRVSPKPKPKPRTKGKAKPKLPSVRMVQSANGKKRIIWSPDRPKRPDYDPMLPDLRAALLRDNRSTFAKANVSGLAPSTIQKIERSITRHPQGTTLQMAWRMLGYDLKPIKRG